MRTNDDRRNRVAQVFESARKLQGGERTRFLDRECGSDAELRGEIEALLRGDESALSLLDQPAINLLQSAEPSTPSWSPGMDVGPYQIVGLLGSGGMGQV
jgi:hypothetical protein